MVSSIDEGYNILFCNVGVMVKGEPLMRVACFDPFCGVAGNMVLGALIDAGAEVPQLEHMLRKLPIKGEWDLELTNTSRKGLRGLLVTVNTADVSPHRTLSNIRDMISSSDLPDSVKTSSISAFRRLAAAEAHVHGLPIEEVHFHETGAVDAIIDIVGSFCALHMLGVERVYSSPVATGTGTISCAHGILPVPAPATAHLLRNIPVSPSGISAELATPTGAVILLEAVSSWEEVPPAMTVLSSGMGAGSADLDRPNLLRASICETSGINTPWSHDTCLQITTVMDDIDMRTWPEVSAGILDAGAYDCYVGNCIGRKGRPALLMTVLCTVPMRDRVIEQVFRSTPTLGMRVLEMPRAILDRDFISVVTEWGPVNVKVGYLAGEPINAEPEYSNCVSLASDNSIETARVITAARAAALDVLLSGKDSD